ncbi:MAG: hypothetical protein KA354_03205 [Phycisphaerae bacterium]|nr:hypothetical protein [Phycisphaerae bacterium]
METALIPRVSTESTAPTRGDHPLSARQALIQAALAACQENPGGIWPSPLPASEILQAAEAVAGRAYGNLGPAFQALVIEGLFFEVHHDLFDAPAYYCSYDNRFLRELLEGDSQAGAWNDLAAVMDNRFGPSTWRGLGLCAGQGRADGWLGPCLGAACPQTRGNAKRCFRGLAFAEGLVVPCPGCGQDTMREELVNFISPIHFQDGQTSHHPCVCEQCIDAREALLRLCNQEHGQAIDWHRTLASFEQALRQVID